jgi:hypothetical protein
MCDKVPFQATWLPKGVCERRFKGDEKGNELTSLIKGISNAFETKPGTSFDTVTSLSHATAKARARVNASSDVCKAEISSTSFLLTSQHLSRKDKFTTAPPSQGPGWKNEVLTIYSRCNVILTGLA